MLEELATLGHEAVDLGTDQTRAADRLPGQGARVGEAIRGGDAERGVLVCGSGVGASVAACKLAGIRAAICHDIYSAHQGVEHDDMNVLCLGSEVVGAELAAELVRVFLAARFDGGERYVRRLEKIEEMEKEKSIWLNRDCTNSSELGQSVWIDFLSRELLQSGKLAQMMDEDAVVGVTSNPTIFQKAIAEGDAYDEQLRELLAERGGPEGVFLAARPPATSRTACDLLRPVWDGGGGQRRLRLDRGRPEPRVRHAGHDRRGPAPARAGRPAEPATSRSRRPSPACRRSRR